MSSIIEKVVPSDLRGPCFVAAESGIGRKTGCAYTGIRMLFGERH